MKIVKFGTALLFAGCSLALGLGAARADDTLFQDLGGRDAIVKIASDTTDNFLADERIKATSTTRTWIASADSWGSSSARSPAGVRLHGPHMHDSHKGLHLTNADFNAVVEDLQKAMDKDGVPFATQNASSRALRRCSTTL